MDESSYLYCCVCAWDAIQQHLKKRGEKKPAELIPVSSGEVQERARGVWEVPRAHVIFDGASLCLFHMGARLADQTTGDNSANLPPPTDLA